MKKHNLYIQLLISMLLLISACTENQVETNERELDNEIRQAVTDLYASIHYDGNEQPDWDQFRSLFIEEAFLIHNTDTTYAYMSPQDFIDAYDGQIESGIIQQATEHEIHQVGEDFAGIAQVFSTYETIVITPEDTLNSRGINSIQLLQSEGEWKIASIVWYDETEEHPIPSAYQFSTNPNDMEYRETIQTYYESYKEADRETLRSLLTDDFRHISSFSEFDDPDVMLDTIWPEVGKSWVEELEIFGEHPEYMVRYKVVGGDRPARYMSEYIRFEGDKIAEIEVFTGREVE